ncbi:MAG: hypothetical protein O7C59_12000 [Rickettsia endosymbiont of Ixodes persulcatus]|nr:hypothetical protein [Rickettsia endosymbiont of Ixodes persulcatus]
MAARKPSFYGKQKIKGMHTKEKRTILSFIIFVSLYPKGIMAARKPVFPSFKIKDFKRARDKG